MLHMFDIESSSWSRATVSVRIERESFARGSLRLAYHLSGLQDVERKELERYREKERVREQKRARKKKKGGAGAGGGGGSSAGEDGLSSVASHSYVAKMSIDPYEERESYFQDVVMQHYARAYAMRYNSYSPPKRIEILQAWLLELTERQTRPLCCVEVRQR